MSSTKRQFSQRSKQLRQKMIKRGLFDEKLQLSELYNALKMFLDWDVIDYTSWVDSENLKDILKEVLEIVQREIAKQRLLEKVWKKVFIVHGFFQVVIKNNTSINQHLLQCFIEQLKHCNNQLLNQPEPSTVETSSPGFFSRSLSKIKRSFSSTSILKLFGSVQDPSTTTNPKSTQRDKSSKMLSTNPPSSSRLNNFMSVLNKQQQKSSNKNVEINSIQKALQTILQEHIKYLQHLITDWPVIHLSLWPYIARTETSTSQIYKTPIQTKNLTSQIVWKLFNYFHILSRINEDFFKLSRVMKGFQVYMYSTLNFIADDLHMLYNPLVSFIVGQIKSIKWEEIVKIIGSNKDKKSLQKFTLHQSQNKHVSNDSISKNNSNQSTSNLKNTSIKTATKLPAYVSQDVLELKTMIQQLGNANEVVLYVYQGSFHSKYLINKKKPSLFVSLNDKLFDSVFEVAKMIEQRENKKGVNGLDGGGKRLYNPEQTVVLNKLQGSNNMMAVKFKTNKLKQMHNPKLKITASKKVELTAETDRETQFLLTKL